MADGSGRLGRLRVLEKQLFPLLVSAFRRADQTALALLARGYDPAIPRTQFTAIRASVRDVAVAGFGLVVSVIAAGLR
jgi:energy-coupling factor transporter transmembrane protein EcfT